MQIWDQANGGRQARYPDTIVVRFVARNYYDVPDRRKIHFLDIGSGRHAPHTRFLESEGFSVTAVDISPVALAHVHQDICALDSFADASFDCVLDFNTLCHVPKPPMRKIWRWLKPSGRFLSVLPRDDTWRGHLANKGYCRCLSLKEVMKLYDEFKLSSIGWSTYSVPQGHEITSWVIEAEK